MKITIPLTALILCVTAVVISRTAKSDEPQKSTGSQLYTPTKLEWLVVELDAECSHRRTNDEPFNMNFVADENNDAIVIFMRYDPTMPDAMQEKAVKFGKAMASMAAKRHGWDSWLHIDEDVKASE